MDSFRKEQKKECLDGSKKQAHKYGCRCCRKIRDLNEHKKLSRKLARVRLKNNDKKDLPETWEDKELRGRSAKTLRNANLPGSNHGGRSRETH